MINPPRQHGIFFNSLSLVPATFITHYSRSSHDESNELTAPRSYARLISICGPRHTSTFIVRFQVCERGKELIINDLEETRDPKILVLTRRGSHLENTDHNQTLIVCSGKLSEHTGKTLAVDGQPINNN